MRPVRATMVANDRRRKRRASEALGPFPAVRSTRAAGAPAREASTTAGDHVQDRRGGSQRDVAPAVPPQDAVASGAVPAFDDDENETLPLRASASAGQSGPTSAAVDGTLPCSPVSGTGCDRRVTGPDASAPWSSWLPSTAMLSHFWSYVMPRTRTVIKEELVAQDVRRGGEADVVVKKVAEALLPTIVAKIEECAASPPIVWTNRPVEEIRAATARVFPTKLVRKVYAKMLSTRVLALATLLAAQGDVVTPLFPPACKLPTSDPFVIDNFNKLLLSILQGLYVAIKATGRVPDVLRGKGIVLSTLLDTIDEACLSQLRTFMNDGRAAARAFFYRFIGYYLMSVSPKVYIHMVHPTAPVPDAAEAEGSDFFAVETCHVASATGVVSAFTPPSSPPPPTTGPSGGTFTTVRSAVAATGLFGWNQAVTRDIGTDSSFTSGTGVYYPHVAGERLVKRKDCLYRIARGMVQHLLKGNAKVDPVVIMPFAQSLRLAVTGPAIMWASADGSPLDHTFAVGPCKWWLLIPRLNTRSALDVKVQALTPEEQGARTAGQNAGQADAVHPAVADNDEEDAQMNEDDAALDGGSDVELDA